MNYRKFGRTGWDVSEIGFGAWAIGGAWGSVDDDAAEAALNTAIDSGVNFIDTADVYGDGRSEETIRRVLAGRSVGQSEHVYVVSKAGRRLNPHVADGYNRENLTAYVERSLTKLGVETIDLVQLHCPPTEVYYRPEVFGVMDDLVAAGKIRHYGVSVEKVEEAIKAIEFENVASVQIIFNMFRQRPADLFFRLAREKSVAILARVPLASGLLSGKMSLSTQFADDDHRMFNRHGEAFDVGETFAGVPYEVGLAAVEKLRALCPADATMAQFALRWILQFDAVSVVIPGARNPEQAQSNAAASAIAPIDSDTLQAVRKIYEDDIKQYVHQRW
jgi:aryl-alcohol dehydrogenase-like predicted oxidoreductase